MITLPAAVEPHAHLDKVFLADVVDNPRGDLAGAIDAMRLIHPRLTVDEVAGRAERAARTMAANGYRAVRTHVDVTAESGTTNVEALDAVRARLAADDVAVTIQIVALAGQPLCGADGLQHRELLAAAVAAGADLVGGCPHLEPGGTAAATETLMALADEFGRGVDLHTDETLDPSADGLSELATRTLATGFDQPVTASHCVSLGMRPPADQQRIAEQVAAAGIGVVALPATNLYLQGREHPQAMPRALTAIGALRAAGVRVAAGADNVQDPFNPLGSLSPFETAALMVLVGHDSPADAWATVSTVAADVVGFDLGDATIDVDAASVRSAIAGGARHAALQRGR